MRLARRAVLVAGAFLALAARAAPQDREPWWNAPFKAFTMPSESMEPTIPPRSYMIAKKRRPAEIRRGDIIVFRVGKSQWVKRVVGLPGDRIAMIGGKLLLNGKAAEYGPGGSYALSRGQTGVRRSERIPGESTTYMIVDMRVTAQDDVSEITVPANRFYLLGDNRDNSTDSRFSLAEGGIETVAFDDVYGIVEPGLVAPGKPVAPSGPTPTTGVMQVVPVERQ